MLPEPLVEMSFVSLPFSLSPVWVNISGDIRQDAGLSWSRGKSDGLSQIQPSTAQFTVDNNGGDYTPDNTGGAHYPHVKIGRAVRIRMTENGTIYFPRFYGFIDTITVQYDNETGLAASTTFTCVDALKMMSRSKMTYDPIGMIVHNDVDLGDYWTLGDPTDTVVPVNSGSLTSTHTTGSLSVWSTVKGPTTGDGVTFGSATGAGFDGLTAADVKEAIATFPTKLIYNSDISGTVFSRIIKLDPSFGVVNMLSANDLNAGSGFLTGANAGVSVYVDAAGVSHLLLFKAVGPGPFTTIIDGPNVNDGATHGYGFSLDYNGTTVTPVLWVDGLQYTGSALTWGASVPAWAPDQSLQSWPVQVAGGGELTGAHLAFFASSATDIGGIHQAGLTGFSPESSAQRFIRLVSLGFPRMASFLSVSTSPGSLNMGPLQNTADTDTLTMLQDVQNVEQGYYFINAAGTLTMLSRFDLYNQAPAITLVSDNYEADLSHLQDDTGVLTGFTAKGTTGNPQTVGNAASADEFGDIDDSITLNVISDNDVLAFAQWRLGDSQPHSRTPSLNVDAMTQQAPFPSLLSQLWQLDLGMLVAVQGIPAAGPASSLSLQALGIAETYRRDSGGGEYTFAIATGAAPLTVWKLQDATLGVLDSTTRLAY